MNISTADVPILPINFIFFKERGKKKGNKGSTNIHFSTIDENDGHLESESHEIIEYISSKGKKGSKKGGKRKGYKKGSKGYKKYMKKITPIALCALALKIIIQHFLIKKIALLSVFSYLLSKTSFILSSLLAIKQIFHSGHHEKSDSGSKLEVVHIPIRKKIPDFHDRDLKKSQSHNYVPLEDWKLQQRESASSEFTLND